MAYNITVDPDYFFFAKDDLSEQIATKAPITLSENDTLLRVQWDSGQVNVDPADIDEINGVALSPKTLAEAFDVINTAIAV